ncbi:serine/threonine-protein kinase Pink1, mitochondrial [Chrysoperla carnea]|uniref:serine/threonine-protein kinase Pink1, mitochondrial n=1 Tax=Chrysoperla carnea TaxID=189513 RepID=UPI001D0883A0|nr:serine/threonine-protein kinase Pink1, mitochondrial [Chrysoperla carnea]
MSLRAIVSRIYKHGTLAIRHFTTTRNYNTATTISDKIVKKSSALQTSATTKIGDSQTTSIVTKSLPKQYGLRNVGLQVGQHARRLFVDNVLNRVTNSLSSELKKRARRRLLFGDSGPFFALVGVSLASGVGILTKDDELEGVCWEIREAISKLKWNADGDLVDDTRKLLDNEEITLADLTLGFPIAKGCSAVVYAAKFNTSNQNDPKSNSMESSNSKYDYPFALKMMFNYDIQSNALAILKAMYRETIPTQHFCTRNNEIHWDQSLNLDRKPILPSHPNIVQMYSVFADYVPNLHDSFKLYPDALPTRINPDGYGRNMSLFLLMKRYDSSLNEYLKSNEIDIRMSILLLTQLLEGVAHINLYGIAHRDLKSDNIVVDMNDDDTTPILAITDFGCCLADNVHGLQLPYNSNEIDKGGNVALMAPEVISQQPGMFSVINYEKSDLWAAATIAYEIFGVENPFYSCRSDENKLKLKSSDYNEDDLPPLPETVPLIIRNLIKDMLIRNPSKRLSAEVAANICELYLWAPSSWFKQGSFKMPSSTEILQWLLCLTTKVMCESRLTNAKFNCELFEPVIVNNYGGRRTYPEYLLISSFLGRVRLSEIRAALYWIHDHM